MKSSCYMLAKLIYEMPILHRFLQLRPWSLGNLSVSSTNVVKRTMDGQAYTSRAPSGVVELEIL